jgi:hypothetical protein
LQPVSGKQGMDAAFFQFQAGDSTLRPQRADTLHSESSEPSFQPDQEEPAAGYFPEHPGDILRVQSASIRPVTVKEVPVEIPKKKDFHPPQWNFNLNFFTENLLTRAVSRNGAFAPGEGSHVATSTGIKPDVIVPLGRNIPHLDWFLGIFLFISMLFIWIRLFYGKYFTTLASAVSSFQMSAKLFRERNVLVRRVSIVLDFIYFVMLSVLIFESVTHFNWVTPSLSQFNLYMLLLNIIIIYSLGRIALLRLTAKLFMQRSLFSEYIHNTLVINKGVGIILFPIVITARYFPFPLISLVLTLGLGILIFAVIWKSIRAYQIIRRKNVVLFYLILYHCTLEFLPLLIGYKVIISLI